MVQFLQKIKAKTRVLSIRWIITAHPHAELVRLGSAYGGWWVPRDLLSQESICYLAGVGEDVTFDLALIGAIGCEVWALDPTPRAIEHASTITEPRFHFRAEGLWREDTVLRFNAPANAAHVSHSVLEPSFSTDGFDAPCRSIRSLMSELGHEQLHLLKMDIEGAEIEVLDDILANGPLPNVLGSAQTLVDT